jgi:hypothetical protein
MYSRDIQKPIKNRKQRAKSSSFGPESEIQACFVKWLRLSNKPVGAVTFSVPNGALRSLAEGKRQKELGLTAGVPDIFIAYPSGNYHGMFIEFKAGANTLTYHQSNMIQLLKARGYHCVVCYEVNNAMQEVTNYLNNVS